MYQPYPTGGKTSGQPARPQPPTSVVTAVRLMYAGAVVTVLSLAVSLATAGSLRGAIHRAHPAFTATQLQTLVGAAVIFDVVSDVIFLAAWIGMAFANRAGRPWARIMASVLFGIDTLFVILSFSQGAASVGSLISVLVWLIGLGAVVMLWRRDSSEFFNLGRVG